MSEYPIELFMDRDNLDVIYARCWYMVGQGSTVEEAIADLRTHLGREARKARIEKAWGVKREEA
jgi:hypothetical protein